MKTLQETKGDPMKQKLLSMALALTMLLSMVPASALAAPSQPFSDVGPNDWFHAEVQYVKDEGLMNGTSDATFNPGGNTTRGMIVTILHRLAGQPSAGTSTFLDVDPSQYYADAVDWAAANGVVTGYDASTFGPNDFITREQLAAIFYRYATLMGYDVSVGEDTNILSYSDALSVNSYAIPAMQWAVGAGLVNGMDDKLAPQGLATRAQVAAILYRFCTQVADETPVAYTVTLILNDGTSAVYKTINAEDGKTITTPKAPARSGYNFGGWFPSAEGGEKFDFSQAITGDLTLYAHWSKAATHSHSYTMVNNQNGTHSKVCRCDRTITEACDNNGENGACSVCGDTTEYVSSINGVQYKTLQEALSAADGETVKLTQDISLDQPLTVTGDVTLDLNGKTISNSNDLWNLETGDFALITVTSGTLTVTGGSLSPKKDDCYPFHVNGGELIIEDGTFVGNVSAVYVTKGTATINGGTFSLDQKANLDSDTSRYTLNCLDANYKGGTADIIVTGGTFENFNPANNASEGPNTNLMGDGYTTLQSGDNWLVVEGSTSDYKVSSAETLKSGASQEHAKVTMTDSIAAEEKITLNGGSLNGDGEILTFDTQSTTATINVGINAKNGADISNLTIADNTKVTGTDDQPRALRAIYLEGTGDFTVDNVYIVSQGYALNTGVMVSPASLTVSNSTLAGWTSFAGVSTAAFTNCKFTDEDQTYKYIRTYVNVTFEACSFDEGYTMDFADGYSGTITLKNCYVGDTLLTAENAKTLLNMDEDTFSNVAFS